MRETLCESVEALQVDLDTWLDHDNTERRHQGTEIRDADRLKPSTALFTWKVKITPKEFVHISRSTI